MPKKQLGKHSTMDAISFDTAEGYGKDLYYPGHNEEIVGRAVKANGTQAAFPTMPYTACAPIPGRVMSGNYRTW